MRGGREWAHLASLTLLAESGALGCQGASPTSPDAAHAPVRSSSVSAAIEHAPRAGSSASAAPAPPEDPEAVLGELRTATREHPDSARAFRELGDRALAFDHEDEAKAAYERSLALAPDQAEVFFALGTIYTGRNQDELARKAYENALRLAPRHHDALFNLGNLYLSEGRLDLAEDLLRRAAPGGGHGSLGRVYAAQGRWEEAAAAFEKGIAEPGTRSPAGTASEYADLGEALLMLRRDADATRALLTARDAYRSAEARSRGREPGAARVAYNLARLAARGGERAQARSYLEEAVRRDPALRVRARHEHDLDPIR